MCCCKKHLHARWAIKALLEYAEKKNTPLAFTDYKGFFEYINTDCEVSAATYVSWDSGSNNNSMCNHSNKNWVSLRQKILADADLTIPIIL